MEDQEVQQSTNQELEQKLAEASSLIDLQRKKLDSARSALQADQVKHALDILS